MDMKLYVMSNIYSSLLILLFFNFISSKFKGTWYVPKTGFD